MEVVVWGESPDISGQEYKIATRWFGDYLLGTKARGLFITLELHDRMRGIRGEVQCTSFSLVPSDFVIRIETGAGKRRRQLYTLAHEMVHVKQLVAREMEIRGGDIRWLRRDHVSAPYVTEPWEQEAYGRERELASKYEAARRLFC